MTANPTASIKARLLNVARARNEEFVWTLSRFASERWLYRLGVSSARDRCLLKGASLLAVWLPDPYRRTQDVDLLAHGPADTSAIRDLITEVCEVSCPEDALRFDLADLAIDDIRAEQEYVGKRARFRAHLDKTRIPMQIDFGFGDAVAIEPQEVELPPSLPSLPASRLRAYPREVSIAEKFEAMVLLGYRNSRMKDFHDLWALAGAFEFDGRALQRAIEACFERRGRTWTAEPPPVLTPEFYADPALRARWAQYRARGGVLIAPPEDFAEIGERLIAFLLPLWLARGAATAVSNWTLRTGWRTS